MISKTVSELESRLIEKYRLRCASILFLVTLSALLGTGCQKERFGEWWEYTIVWDDKTLVGTLKMDGVDGVTKVSLVSLDWGTYDLENVSGTADKFVGSFTLFKSKARLEGTFKGDTLLGNLRLKKGNYPFVAIKLSEIPSEIDRSEIPYVLSDSDVSKDESNIDHAGILANADRNSFLRGERIYVANCINCHGTEDIEGSIPLSNKFWKQPLKAGSDAFSMYQSVTRGFGSMPPQVALTPQEKYDVISYIRHKYIRNNTSEVFVANSPGYLAGLPKGNSRGPKAGPYQPWSDMDYGPFLINTYELVDGETGLERYHSPGPVPYPDEDYSKNNFAYKGIAIRLDKGEGGVSKGKAWMIFDHDLMRVAGGWTGKGFVDWDGILLNDKHETYPRTVGKLHFGTAVSPGWANPRTGSFVDPRFRARDGRAFGPLPKVWADYKGLYHHGDHVIISYRVGDARILEELGMESHDDEVVFTRTLDVTPGQHDLKMKVAPIQNKVAVIGDNVLLEKEEGYTVLKISHGATARIKLFIGDTSVEDLEPFMENSGLPEPLIPYTTGGNPHYMKKIKTAIVPGREGVSFAVDQLLPPFENPWASRMKLSGIDFKNGGRTA
ncbi:MAG: cytochrome c, partial [Bacteroidota bacterium]